MHFLSELLFPDIDRRDILFNELLTLHNNFIFFLLLSEFISHQQLLFWEVFHYILVLLLQVVLQTQLQVCVEEGKDHEGAENHLGLRTFRVHLVH